jgi:hypothetical protein
MGLDIDEWKPIPMEKIMNGGEPTRYLVDGIIEEKSLNVFYGAPASFKTMILMDCAICVAAGIPWLADDKGKGGFETRQCPVVWLDFDNGENRVLKRFHAMLGARGLLGKDVPMHVYAPDSSIFDASDARQVDMVSRLLDKCKAGLTVADNLCLISGATDENSADMKTVMSNLRMIINRTGSSFVPIHHQKKGRSEGRAGDSLRGHSSIEASLDLAMLVGKEGNHAKMTPTKVRGAEISIEVLSEFYYTHNPGTKDLRTALFYGLSRAIKQVRNSVDVKRVVIDYVGGTTKLNKGELIDTIIEDMKNLGERVSKKSVTSAIDELIVEGILRDERGRKNASYLRIV